MVPTKNKKTSGFMIFANEWKAKNGKQLKSGDTISEAGKYWVKLSPQERIRYNDMAKSDNSQRTSEKLACTGVPISLIEKEKKEQDQKLRGMRKTIEKIVQNSVMRNEIATQRYYFVMVNYFTKTLQGGVYLPAEISVCEFSLKNGLNNKFHSFVNPGINIYGHTYEAQAHSNSTHQLPLPPNAMGESQLGKLYNSILEFIKPNANGEYPPLFTHCDSIPIVESAINFLKTDSEAKNINLQIYSIQYLFYTLKGATCEIGEIEKPISHYLTDAYFERDIFEYMVGIACKFHEDADKSNYCTLSCVTRWCYTFADYMLSDIAIKCIPGRHLPLNTRVNASTSSGANAMSDTESFVSMASESTYVSKALTESKVYYDDQQPATLNRSTMFKKDDFPDLTGKNRKKTRTQPVQEYSQYLDKDDYIDVNRWAERSRHVPPQPDESHFKIDVSQAQDRMTDLNERDDASSIRSFGRGRIFKRGFGRGNLLDH